MAAAIDQGWVAQRLLWPSAGDWLPAQLDAPPAALNPPGWARGATPAAGVISERAEPENPAPPNPKAKEQSTPEKKRFHPRKTGTGLKRDLSGALNRLRGADLTPIIGLNVLGLPLLLSATGLDTSRWRSAKACCAGLELGPGNKISGGRGLSSSHCAGHQSRFHWYYGRSRHR